MNDIVKAVEPFDLPVDLGLIEYTVRHPVTDAPTSAMITLAGPTHPVRKAAMFARMRSLMSDGSVDKVDPMDADDEETAFIAACTLGWIGLSTGGKTRVFAIGAPQTLYQDPQYRWLRDQLRDVLRQRERFIGACAIV